MSMHPKHISRANDMYPAWDLIAVNNVGSPLNVGDVVLLDWTPDGVACSIIAPSTAALITTHMKAVVLPQPNQTGIAVGTTGQVRVQGVCNAGLTIGQAATSANAFTITIPANGTIGAQITPLAVTSPGTNSTYIQSVSGAFLTTQASSASASLVNCIFDGTDINAVFLKD